MYDYKNKSTNVSDLNNYMLTKTLSMFEYEGLPETIPQVELEKLLQVNGFAFITEVNGLLYAFTGGLGGVPDVYGNPTKIVISNPALNFNKELSIKDDGVLINGDSRLVGLMPLFNKHNSLLAENDINMVIHGYNSRIQRMISASDEKTRANAEAYLKKVIDGDIGVIGENAMFDGVKNHAVSSSGSEITTMIEYHQYIKSSLFNEIGLNQNFNMKRERLVSAEVDQIKESIYPFVYDMMKCRINAIEKLNSKYGIEVEIDFGSVWAVNFKSYVDGVVDPTTQNTLTDTTTEPVSGAAEETGAVAAESLEPAEAAATDTETEDVAEVETANVEVAPITPIEDEEKKVA